MQRGFTLLELMVVLAIMAIITAIALLSFGDFGQKRAVRLAAAQLQQALAIARSKAIITARTYTVQFKKSGYQFLRLSRQNKWTPLQDDALSAPDAFSDKMQYTLTFKNKKEKMILIDGNGLITPFDFRISGQDTAACLSVYRNGQIKTVPCDPEASHA